MGNKLSEVMHRDLVLLDAKATAREAATRMQEQHVGSVLVTKNGELCGIVTDRDLVVRCIAEGKDPEKMQLRELCSKELVTLKPDAEIGEAVRAMTDRAVRRVPVVDGKKPVGIVSLGDLAISQDRGSALGAISAAQPNH